MTTTIGASLRAYQLGDEFRKRGIPVVMGGFHATLQTEEALKHADAVVQGEADLVWEPLLRDWQDGKLKQIYKADKLHDLKNSAAPASRAAQAQSLPVQGGAGAGEPRMPVSLLVLRNSGLLRGQLSHAPDRGHRRGNQAGDGGDRLSPLPVHRRPDHRQAQVRARTVPGARFRSTSASRACGRSTRTTTRSCSNWRPRRESSTSISEWNRSARTACCR